MNSLPNLGVSTRWPTRQKVAQWSDKAQHFSMQRVSDYVHGTDLKNTHNVPPYVSFLAEGSRLRSEAQALAFSDVPWEEAMRDALGYSLIGDRLGFFWHLKFREIFPNHSQPLRLMNWEVMSENLALLLILGMVQDGIYQGYLTHAALNQSFQLQLSYESKHRCGLAFILRLFSNWRGDARHEWLPFAYNEPIYEEILRQWNNPDAEILTPLLLAACDRHTHESELDSETEFHDFSKFPRTPIEILFLFRLRELNGLANVRLEHPLMEKPFDALPPAVPPYNPDEMVQNTLSRVRADWPDFEALTSSNEIRALSS